MKKYEMKNNLKNRGFGLGFTLITQNGFHQNNDILLQQHWSQGLQIGLPS